ncbi:MAG: hypothetical protein ABI767_08310 [Rhodanobacter sp.]
MRNLWLSFGWLVLVALLPWWLGLPLLLTLAGVALLLQTRLDVANLQWIRAALRWGLPGLLASIVYTLGGDVLAWVVAMVAALAGFTLLAGVEAWLDRDQRRVPEPVESAEWPELAQAHVGPAATLIELQPPLWMSTTEWVDPRGQRVSFRDDSFHFADGTVVDNVEAMAGFSPDGNWFFARIGQPRGIVLWDRDNERPRRLSGWDLCGWYHGEPWLIRGDDGVPQALSAVIRRRRD